MSLLYTRWGGLEMLPLNTRREGGLVMLWLLGSYFFLVIYFSTVICC